MGLRDSRCACLCACEPAAADSTALVASVVAPAAIHGNIAEIVARLFIASRHDRHRCLHGADWTAHPSAARHGFRRRQQPYCLRNRQLVACQPGSSPWTCECGEDTLSVHRDAVVVGMHGPWRLAAAGTE